MKLTDKDYREIAAKIEIGTNSIEYEKDGETLSIEYEFVVDGYFEDDRENGTGGFVETGRMFYINSCQAYNKDGSEIPCEVDEVRLERLVA